MFRRMPYLVSILLLAAIMLAACAGGGAQQIPTPTAASVAQPTEAPKPTEAGQPPEAAPPTEAAKPTEESKVMLPEVAPADYTDPIVSAGSSTVYPLSERMADLWQGEGGGNVTIDSIGSGAGFERFCKTGETDISNASRKIKDSEVESCTAIGRTPIEFRIGTDALAVVVSHRKRLPHRCDHG